jgi:serine/threonine-protein kinase
MRSGHRHKEIEMKLESKITHHAIRAQLGEILASESFVRARRMQRFLKFIVEEALAGRANQLGEYGIGVGVFDRGPDFEPALDPIVRNDARRLRVKLAEFYVQPEGRGASVIIEMPKGGYVPHFRHAGQPAQSSPANSHRLGVLPFEVITPDSTFCGRALCMSLTAGLTNLDGIETVAHGFVRDESTLSHVVSGCVWKSGDRFRVTVNLIQTSQSLQVWAKEFEFASAEMLSAHNEISRQLQFEVTSRLTVSQAAPRYLAMAA